MDTNLSLERIVNRAFPNKEMIAILNNGKRVAIISISASESNVGILMVDDSFKPPYSVEFGIRNTTITFHNKG